VTCVQNAFGIGAPAAEHEFLLACGEQGVAYVPFFAIAGQGRDSGAGLPDDEDVTAVAGAHGVTAARVRLAWTLQLGPHVLAIPGTGNPDHLEANVSAGALRLPAEDMRRLASIQSAART
jgi:pyridoxine 4-dehydrogenase